MLSFVTVYFNMLGKVFLYVIPETPTFILNCQILEWIHVEGPSWGWSTSCTCCHM